MLSTGSKMGDSIVLQGVRTTNLKVGNRELWVARNHLLPLKTKNKNKENKMAICYSTDKIEMAEIKGRRPFHKSKEQKLNLSINECRRFGDTYSLKSELQRENSNFNKNRNQTRRK